MQLTYVILEVFNLFMITTIPILMAVVKGRAPSWYLTQLLLPPSQHCHGLTSDDNFANTVKVCQVPENVQGAGKN